MSFHAGLIIYCACRDPNCHILTHVEIVDGLLNHENRSIVYKVCYCDNKTPDYYNLDDKLISDIQNVVLGVFYKIVGILRRVRMWLFQDIHLVYDYTLDIENYTLIKELDPTLEARMVSDSSDLVDITNQILLEKSEVPLSQVLHFIWNGCVYGRHHVGYEGNKVTEEDTYTEFTLG